MSTFGISQNFRSTSIVGRFGRTVAPEPEKVVIEKDEKDDEDDEDYDSEEDEDDSKKSKASKSSKSSVDASATSKKYDERISLSTQFASFTNRYTEKTADHH
jgi:hypothetical protein